MNVVSDIVTDAAEGARLLERDAIALDIETGGLNWHTDPIAVLTLYGARSRVPVVLHIRGRPIPDCIRDVLHNAELVIGHNLVAFDALFLAREGVDLRRVPIFDTLVAEQVCNVQGRRDVSASLKATLARRVGKRIRKDADHESWMNETLDPEQLRYVVDDVRHLHELREAQLKRGEESAQLGAIEFEMRLAPVVIGMTLAGFPVDVPRFLSYSEQALREAETVLQKYEGINLRSPAQVRELFRRVGVELEDTSKDTLSFLASEGATEEIRALANDIITARLAFKLDSTYGEWWVERFVHNGRVHARWWQCGTDTTRFSSSDPNMQQVPRMMRPAFGGLDGVSILSVDYSQIEVRVAAKLANDRKMIELLSNADDLHGQVARLLFGPNYGKPQRDMAKAITFTMLFGGTPQGIQRYTRMYGLNLSLDEATRVRHLFVKQFPGLDAMIRRARERAKMGAPTFVKLPTGHKRLLVGKQLTTPRLLNSAIQGWAAAGIKMVMLRLAEAGLDRYLRLQVHDELVFEVPDDVVDEVAREVEHIMQSTMEELLHPVKVMTTRKLGRYWS